MPVPTRSLISSLGQPACSSPSLSILHSAMMLGSVRTGTTGSHRSGRMFTPDVPPDMATYAGSSFKKADLENIPARDLPFGVPKWMGTGDMAWRTSPTQVAWKSLAAEGAST